MTLIDTHCHIHESEFFDAEQQSEVFDNAIKHDVGMICVATSEQGCDEAIAFTKAHENTWAVLGVHPHETDKGWGKVGELLGESHEKVVGIGEIGLDYFYLHSPRDVQIRAFEAQLQLAQDYNLPVSFHVRDSKGAESSVWDDFWPILDNFRTTRGVLHSFTDVQAQLDKGFDRGLYVAVNGISTFTKDPLQQELYKSIPLEKLLLETDAPFLTPAPLRGRMNQPSFVGRVAEHMATVRGVSLDLVSTTTTANARKLFSI